MKVSLLKCDKSNFKSGSEILMKNHKILAHEEVSYSCNKCEYKAITTHNPNEHIRSTHEETTYSIFMQ